MKTKLYYFSILKILFFFIFISINFTLFSQKNGQLIYETKSGDLPFTITQYSTKHGLVQNQVLSIIESINGGLILTTANGIVKFNGSAFTEFKYNKQIKKLIFSDLIEIDSNRIIGNLFGRLIFSLYPKFLYLNNSGKIIEFKDCIYGINFRGAIYSAKKRNLKFKKNHSSEIYDPISFYVNENYFYVGTHYNLYQIDRKTYKKKILLKEYIAKIKEINKNEIHILTKNSFYKYVNNKMYKIATFPIEGFCNDFVQIRNNEFYISSSNGLIELKNRNFKIYTKKDNMPSENFFSIYYSKKSNVLFLGTGEKGLLQLNFKTCRSINKPVNLSKNSLSSIINYHNKILITSNDGEIFELDKKSEIAKTYIKKPELFSCLASISDTLVVGTWGDGILLYKDKNFIRKINSKKQLLNKTIHACFKDSQNKIWIGTSKGISIGSNLNNIKPFTHLNESVICFYELKNKSICVGTSNGFRIYDSLRKLIYKYTSKNGFFGKEVRCFYEDHVGKIWIGSYNGGLYCLDKNKVTNINLKSNCKLPLDIFCIAKDKFSRLYFTGNLGLYSVTESELNAFYYNQLKYLIPMSINEESGILNTEFNGGFQHNYLFQNGHFYFPTIEGITILKPEKKSKKNLHLKIDEIHVNDSLYYSNNEELIQQKFKKGNLFLLKPETYNIKVIFSTVNFKPENQVYYQYKLIGGEIEKEWSNLTSTNHISLNFLSNGKYKLLIKAIDSFNEKNPIQLVFNFEIKAYFYQTLLFKVIVFIFIILSIIYVINLRIKISNRKIIKIERINNQIIEFKLAAIHARMNPHFIFNSLNNIKYLLAFNKVVEAEQFVDDFSDLLRKFLIYSDQTFIQIYKELEIINLYVKLEKSRLPKGLIYKLEVDKDLYKTKIPTILIQPFIENAFKHGISHATYKCELNIKFYTKNNFIYVEISDNGIGFEKSKLINQTRSYHDSKGIKLIDDKIKNLKEKYDIFVSYKISNLNEKEPFGTKIIIKILMDHIDEVYHN